MTTPTFRVADGMLVENAREQRPDADKYEDNTSGLKKYRKDIEQYRAHLASLRSIPIAPGCVLEGESLKENEDFRIEVDYSQGTGSPEYAWPIKKENELLCSGCDGLGFVTGGILCAECKGTGEAIHCAPARAFSLAEALEIWEASRGWDASRKTDSQMKTYFKQRFNIDI